MLGVSGSELITRKSEIKLALAQLKVDLHLTNEDIFLLPLMPWELSDKKFEEAYDDFRHNAVILTAVLKSETIAELIGTSLGYIGNSLHGLITAIAYEVPAVLVLPSHNKNAHKYYGFLKSVGMSSLKHLAVDWGIGQKDFQINKFQISVKMSCTAWINIGKKFGRR